MTIKTMTTALAPGEPGAVVFSRNDEIVGPGGQHDW